MLRSDICVVGVLILMGCGGRGVGLGDDGGTTGGEGTESASEDTGVPMDVGEGPLPPAPAIAVSVGAYRTCAVLADGGVRCFGREDFWGALGTGEVAPAACDEDQLVWCPRDPACCLSDDEPLDGIGDVDLGASAVSVAATAHSTCALLSGGWVKCWGDGDFGLTGQATTENVGDDEVPADVDPIDLGGVATQLELSRGYLGGPNFYDPLHNRHACARLDDGTLRCWGLGDIGALGYGNTETIGDDEVPGDVGPVPVGGLVKRVAVGGGFTCALLEQGDVRCWGFNEHGELGLGIVPSGACGAWGPVECREGCCLGHEQPASEIPVVPLGQAAIDLVAGARFACARVDANGVRCWGADWTAEGESAADAERIEFGAEIQGMYAGLAELCVTLTDGRLQCTAPDAVVEDVELGGPVVAVSLGSVRCALLADQSLRCWGDNRNAQLGQLLPPACFDDPQDPGTLSFDCAHGSACCLGDDEALDTIPPVPL